MISKKGFFIISAILIIISILLVFILKIDIKELVINKESQVVNKEEIVNKEITGSSVINKDNGTFQSSLGGGGR